MSTEIPTSFVRQYEATVQHLAQQEGSKLRNTVDVRTGMTGEAAFFDQIGSVETSEKTGRHTPIEFSDTPHARRMVVPSYHRVADAVDSDDKLKQFMADPANEYSQAQGWAIGRRVDKTVIGSATATAKTGKTGSTNTSFPGSQQIAANYVETGSPAASDLTIGKLRRTVALFLSNDIEVSPDRITVAISSRQKHALLFDRDLTTIERNNVRALVNLETDVFLGMRFVTVSDGLLPKSGDVRSVLVYDRMGIRLGFWQEPQSRMDQRVDLDAMPMQVYSSVMLGATRMEEERVVEVLCDETADFVDSSS